ncbi:MAG: helix-turn-helix domain-containing protein, partial [Polyangiales bacterium]
MRKREAVTDTGQRLTAMLWERATPPRRGPRRTLTLDAIGRIGITIADAEGLGGVTMQRVAAGLGVTKMALYRYVPGKAELVALMIDIGVGPPPRRRARPQRWRSATVAWARALFAIFSQHPWAFGATVGPRVLGPNELGWLEHAVAVLDDTPLRGAEKLDV